MLDWKKSLALSEDPVKLSYVIGGLFQQKTRLNLSLSTVIAGTRRRFEALMPQGFNHFRSRLILKIFIASLRNAVK